jgi:hypothetical protein
MLMPADRRCAAAADFGGAAKAFGIRRRDQLLDGVGGGNERQGG